MKRLQIISVLVLPLLACGLPAVLDGSGGADASASATPVPGSSGALGGGAATDTPAPAPADTPTPSATNTPAPAYSEQERQDVVAFCEEYVVYRDAQDQFWTDWSEWEPDLEEDPREDVLETLADFTSQSTELLTQLDKITAPDIAGAVFENAILAHASYHAALVSLQTHYSDAGTEEDYDEYVELWGDANELDTMTSKAWTELAEFHDVSPMDCGEPSGGIALGGNPQLPQPKPIGPTPTPFVVFAGPTVDPTVGTVTFVNQSAVSARFEMWAGDRYTLDVEPGATRSLTLPVGEYGWTSFLSTGCQLNPTNNLPIVAGSPITINVLPAADPCGAVLG